MAEININEMLGTIKDKVSQTSQLVLQKTKDSVSIAKARLAIRSEEDTIRKAQLELGKLYYKDYIAGEEPDPAEYTPWCEKINEAKISIEDLKAAIEELKSSGLDEDDEIVVEITEDDLVQETEAPAETPAEAPAAEETAPEE